MAKDSISTRIDSVKSKTVGKPFFDYDELTHYKINITDEDFEKIDWNKSKNKLLFNILTGFDQKEFKDAVFWKNFDKIEKKQYQVNKKYFEELNSEIFVEKEGASRGSACVPLFRDILIFKKNSKMIGMARICFKCEINIIEGSTANVESFGQNDQYKRLSKILEENLR